MKNTFVVSCPIDTYSGYGARARDFVKSIVELDKYDVKILSQRWGSTTRGFIDQNEKEWGFLQKHIIPGLQTKPDIWCQVTVPNEFQPMGKYNIGLTAGMETTHVHSSWVEGCNRMNLILTSSKHSKQTFINSQYQAKDGSHILKVEKPIEVLFEGVNLDVYKKIKEFKNKDLKQTIESIPEKFAYLTVGHWMQGEMGHDRKNIGLTVKAFYEIFKDKPDKPALILKTCAVGGSNLDRAEMLRRIELIRESCSSDDLPNVYLLHGDFTDTEMNEIYNNYKVKAMISLTKGEGFGRPLLEFSVLNKPIITTGWSGQVDFLSKDYVFELGGELEPVHQSAQVKDMILGEAQWFKVGDQWIANAYQDVYQNYKSWKDKSKTQGFNSRKNFSFKKMKTLIEDIFKENIPELPKKMELKLPSMNKIKMPKKDKLKIVK
jgi:glycosyltransferase involved in cell wall biosynthesis